MPLDPGVVRARRHDHDLQLRSATQAFGQRDRRSPASSGTGSRCRSRARRGRWNRGTASRPRARVLAVVARLGARNADIDIGEVRRHRVGPRIAAAARPPACRRWRGTSVRAPAAPGARRLAIDHHLDVVERPVGMAGGIDALAILGRMGGRVPAPDREIEPAREGQRIVDHHDLLVLRAAEGNGVVDAQRHALGRPPAQRQARQQLALAGIEQRVVPQQQVDVQVGPALDQARSGTRRSRWDSHRRARRRRRRAACGCRCPSRPPGCCAGPSGRRRARPRRRRPRRSGLQPDWPARSAKRCALAAENSSPLNAQTGKWLCNAIDGTSPAGEAIVKARQGIVKGDGQWLTTS